MHNAPAQPDSTTRLLLFASLIVCVSMGIRHTFGLFLGPMTTEQGWSREGFAFALALQNLIWGAAQPVAGLLADRFGAKRVLWVGGLLYAAGLSGMALAGTTAGFAGSAGLLIGLALSGTTYSVVFSALGKQVAENRRSWAMGLVAAAGSFGQFAMVPGAAALIAGMGWLATLLLMAAASLAMVPLGSALTRGVTAVAQSSSGGARQALSEAASERGFLLLMSGYFVCGFQVVFIGVHFPTYLLDKGFSANVGMTALALIGLFNIFGTYSAGLLGSRVPKRYVLAAIYFSRSAAISIFLWAPLSNWSVYVFASVMGFLWLSTVPLTNGIVAQVFGVRFLGMLSGLVFFSHQVGSFLGVWLGGLLFDLKGSYDAVWMICIALGLMAGLVNLPVDERSRAQRMAEKLA